MSRRQGAHHLGHGWYAARGDGGTVTLWAGEQDAEITVEATVWAKLIAAVSAMPDQKTAYRLALALHEGNRDT